MVFGSLTTYFQVSTFFIISNTPRIGVCTFHNYVEIFLLFDSSTKEVTDRILRCNCKIHQDNTEESKILKLSKLSK